jgi:hypothetical protein
MGVGDIQVKITYEQIDDTHLLIHAYCSGFINRWVLVDLEELALGSGKSVEQLLNNLRKNLHKNDDM